MYKAAAGLIQTESRILDEIIQIITEFLSQRRHQNKFPQQILVISLQLFSSVFFQSKENSQKAKVISNKTCHVIGHVI